MVRDTIDKWWPVYLVGIFIGVGFGWLLSSAMTNQQTNAPKAVILMDAFHSGWVPQALSLGGNMEINLAKGEFGSEIRVPLGTIITFILRNDTNHDELHQSFDTLFQDYFASKVGEDWPERHEVLHASTIPPSMLESPDDDTASVTPVSASLQQDFQLEGYQIQIVVPQDPLNNVKMVEFVADQPGEFKYQCFNMCMEDTKAMMGKLVVVSEN